MKSIKSILAVAAVLGLSVNAMAMSDDTGSTSIYPDAGANATMAAPSGSGLVGAAYFLAPRDGER